MFHARGWSLGTSSNYSVVVERNPLSLLITASGKDKGRLTVEDFTQVDQNGQLHCDDHPAASAETLLHCVLAQWPEVGCVLHTHSIWGTILSDIYSHDGGFAIENFEMLKGLEGIRTHQHRLWIDIFENTQDIAALADEIRDRYLPLDVSERPYGFLMRQHGLYTWGKDLFAARRHIEVFEFLFECVARKLVLQGNLPASAFIH